MDASKRKETISKFTILAVIVSVVVFLASIFLGLIRTEEADFSIRGAVTMFTHNPLYWLFLLLSISLPLTTYFLLHRMTHALYENQVWIDKETETNTRINKFTEQLIVDNLEATFDITDENDLLGKSMLRLRDTLNINKENNIKLRTAEEQRNWIAEGLARVSEILRNNLHNLEQLSFHVIKDVTKYVNAVQGGFYVLDDSDKGNRFFRLTSFFAYDRRKFADQQIKWGDGLIGTCALEQKVIHLKSIPDSYISVTSGLGEANPGSLLIVPMQYETEIYGVLEFASFKPFEANHIELIERVAESVASTLSAVKTNIRTAELLEESKAQTQALTSHEEEMRQNMEELQATQEEATRQAERFMLLEETINQNLIKAEFDDDGKFLAANHLFFQKFEFPNDKSIHGKHFLELISADVRDSFTVRWKAFLRDGISIKTTLKHTTRTGNELWTMSSLNCHKTEDGQLEKIMFLAFDSTEEVSQNQKNDRIIEAIDTSGIRFELDVNGNFHDYNTNFIHLLKSSQKDLKSLVIFDIIEPIEMDSFNKRWDGIIKGNRQDGISKLKSPDGREIVLQGSYVPVSNASHEVNRIAFTGHDISMERRLETENKNQAEVLKRQEKMLKDSEKEMAARIRELRLEHQNLLKETERYKRLNEGIMDESPDAVVTTGHDNRICFFNKEAENLWKMKRQDVLGQDVNVLFAEKHTEENELLASFVRPGDHKILGKKSRTFVTDSIGKEKPVVILLGKIRIDSENFFTAFLQSMEI